MIRIMGSSTLLLPRRLFGCASLVYLVVTFEVLSRLLEVASGPGVPQAADTAATRAGDRWSGPLESFATLNGHCGETDIA